MKIDPIEPNDDWLADEYWGPDQDEPEEESDEEEFIEQSEETIKEMSDES
tara:strand:+ start:339 stop:488 length:150 start_codon:yes stop_codon:yes gene_type:complete